MTREEAFKRLEQMHDFYAHAMDSDKNHPFAGDAEAIKYALWAMIKDRGAHITREQVEKMRGKWIDARYSSKDVPKCQCSICEKKYIGLETDFCQYCGAPMTDKAVDILWKRLEAMQDEAETD